MEYRIVVLGAPGVGKSDLIRHYIMGASGKKYDPMIEDSYRKEVTIEDKRCILDITATVGVEEWSALRDQYISTGEGFVLVYNITSTTSFEAAGKLRASIFRYKNEADDIPIMLVGTMNDLESKRAVSTAEGQTLADNWRSGFLEVSAKSDNTSLNQIFIDLVRLIDKWRSTHSAGHPLDISKVKTKKRSWTLR